jgi:hypothetical protein
LGSLTFAVTAYLAGRFLDAGISARTVATSTGVLMLVPAALLAIVLHAGRSRQAHSLS